MLYSYIVCVLMCWGRECGRRRLTEFSFLSNGFIIRAFFSFSFLFLFISIFLFFLFLFSLYMFCIVNGYCCIFFFVFYFVLFFNFHFFSFFFSFLFVLLYYFIRHSAFFVNIVRESGKKTSQLKLQYIFSSTNKKTKKKNKKKNKKQNICITYNCLSI